MKLLAQAQRQNISFEQIEKRQQNDGAKAIWQLYPNLNSPLSPLTESRNCSTSGLNSMPTPKQAVISDSLLIGIHVA